ncbi:hypothetical protein VTI74DRAFT_2802 [Chaetomium olivicolor]
MAGERDRQLARQGHFSSDSEGCVVGDCSPESAWTPKLLTWDVHNPKAAAVTRQACPEGLLRHRPSSIHHKPRMPFVMGRVEEDGRRPGCCLSESRGCGSLSILLFSPHSVSCATKGPSHFLRWCFLKAPTQECRKMRTLVPCNASNRIVGETGAIVLQRPNLFGGMWDSRTECRGPRLRAIPPKLRQYRYPGLSGDA